MKTRIKSDLFKVKKGKCITITIITFTIEDKHKVRSLEQNIEICLTRVRTQCKSKRKHHYDSRHLKSSFSASKGLHSSETSKVKGKYNVKQSKGYVIIF